MSLVDHARRELELCGQFASDPAYAQSIVAAVGALATYGYSGGSMGAAVHQLTTLLGYGTLSPLTNDPAEWMHVGTQNDKPLYQSLRNPQAFSTDGGKTYYLLDERDAARDAAARAAEVPMHTSRPRDFVGDPVPEEPRTVNACAPALVATQ